MTLREPCKQCGRAVRRRSPWHLHTMVDESAVDLGLVASGEASERSGDALESLREFCVTQCCFVMLGGGNCNGRHTVSN
jgi:hypothetical protein